MASNYESLFIEALEQLIIEAGGIVLAMSQPTNFQKRSLDLLTQLSSLIGSSSGDLTAHTSDTNNPHSVTRAQIGAAASGANSDITSLSGITGSITIGGKKHTRSATQPSSPAVGDTWEELNGSSNIVERWEWNGALWLGPSRTESAFSITSGGFPLLSIFRPRFGFDVFLEVFTIFGDAGVTNDASNHHSAFLQILTTSNNGGTSSNLATINTSTVPSDNFFKLSTTLNQQVVFSKISGASSSLETTNFVGFRTAASTTGSPSNLSHRGVMLTWREARP